nr:uncharacterized protein c18h10.07 [Quercus suber]
MSEYWKSTPSYWCKFCSTYVKDTHIERKNHEASGKHQGSIQRSLRDLHKNKAHEERDKQRAKDEVARLNGLVNGKPVGGSSRIGGLTEHSSHAASRAGPSISAADQRRKNAMELAALGVELPPELKQEITGVGSWQTVSETVIQSHGERTMADMLKEEQESKSGALSPGILKRKLEEGVYGDTQADATPIKKSKAWGSNLKVYPGGKTPHVDDIDLNTLLGGISKKKPKVEDEEEDQYSMKVKLEDDESGANASIPPPIDDATTNDTNGGLALPAVIFKKRKGFISVKIFACPTRYSAVVHVPMQDRIKGDFANKVSDRGLSTFAQPMVIHFAYPSTSDVRAEHLLTKVCTSYLTCLSPIMSTNAVR